MFDAHWTGTDKSNHEKDALFSLVDSISEWISATNKISIKYKMLIRLSAVRSCNHYRCLIFIVKSLCPLMTTRPIWVKSNREFTINAYQKPLIAWAPGTDRHQDINNSSTCCWTTIWSRVNENPGLLNIHLFIRRAQFHGNSYFTKRSISSMKIKLLIVHWLRVCLL